MIIVYKKQQETIHKCFLLFLSVLNKKMSIFVVSEQKTDYRSQKILKGPENTMLTTFSKIWAVIWGNLGNSRHKTEKQIEKPFFEEDCDNVFLKTYLNSRIWGL